MFLKGRFRCWRSWLASVCFLPCPRKHKTGELAAVQPQLAFEVSEEEASLRQLRLELLRLGPEERRDALLAWDSQHGPALAEIKNQRSFSWGAQSGASSGKFHVPVGVSGVEALKTAADEFTHPGFSREVFSFMCRAHEELAGLRALHAHDPETLREALLEREPQDPRLFFPVEEAVKLEEIAAFDRASASVVVEASPDSPQSVRELFALRQELRDQLRGLPRPVSGNGYLPPAIEAMEAWRDGALILSGEFQSRFSNLQADMESRAHEELLKSPLSIFPSASIHALPESNE